jgi:hypothetical protein
MQFNAKIIAISPAELKQSKNGKSYSQIEVTYKDLDKDQTKSKKLMSFDKALYQTFCDASPGQTYNVTVEKEGEFWNWKSVTSGASATPEPSKPSGFTKSYDGGDSRQVSIIRQSTLKASVDWCKDREGLTLADVFTTAKLFQDYVNNIEFEYDTVVEGYDPEANQDVV